MFLALLGYLKDKAWFYEGLGVGYPATNAMALILFMLVVPVFTFLLQPLIAMYSRKHEFEADAYAARYSSARELVSALVKLYKDNASTLTPDPLHSAFYDSHPPASIRIARLQSMRRFVVQPGRLHGDMTWTTSCRSFVAASARPARAASRR